MDESDLALRIEIWKIVGISPDSCAVIDARREFVLEEALCEDIISMETGMQQASYTAVIEYDADARMYVGSILELPGAHTQATTLEELRGNLTEVTELVIADMLEHGETIAAPRFVGTLQISTGIL